MSISVNWVTRVITVPRADLTLIQLVPTEIRELNLNQFHLWLKNAEDSEEGMPFPDTHLHNTEVILGGIVYARVIAMINGYTVTFEDGMYAVNLVGANSNVGDVVNVNSVSVRSQNSAGLISTQTMEYSSFDDCVAIDVVTGVAGTVFPTGTKLRPSNNLTDALLIASVRGITRLLFLSDYTFPAGTLVANMTLMGEGMQRTTLTFQPGSIIAYCFLRDARVTGRMTGVIGIDDCHVNDFGSVGLIPTSQTIIVRQCLLDGVISLPPNYSGTLKALDCWSNTPGAAMPILDMGGSTANLLVRNYSGDLALRNQTHASYIEMDFTSGHLTLEPTVTAGTFILRGVGTLLDQSTGTTVDVDGLISKQTVAEAVEDQIGDEVQYGAFQGCVRLDVVGGTPGTAYPIGTALMPVNNIADARTIALSRGFDVIHLISDTTVVAGAVLDELTIRSDDWRTITLEAGVSLVNTVFEKLSVYGAMGGFWNVLIDCWTYDITNFCGWLRGGSYVSVALAPYTVESAGQSFFDSILPMYPSEPSVLTMNTDTEVSFTNAIDVYQINGMTAGSIVSFDLGGGTLTLDSSCTGGDLTVFGIGTLIDDSVGVTVDSSGLVSGGGGGESFDDAMDSHRLPGTVGEAIYLAKQLQSGRVRAAAATMQHYADDGATVVREFDLLNAAGQPAGAAEDVVERVPK